MKPFIDFKSILDLGCGGPIDELSTEVAHYDICHHNVKYYTKKYENHNNINCRKWTIGCDIPYTSAYDTIYMIGIFKGSSLNTIIETLNQASNRLKTNGKIAFTTKLYNTISSDIVENNYKHRKDGTWRYKSLKRKEIVVPETIIRRTLINNGLMIQDPISYGQWCYNDSDFEEDLIVALRHR